MNSSKSFEIWDRLPSNEIRSVHSYVYNLPVLFFFELASTKNNWKNYSFATECWATSKSLPSSHTICLTWFFHAWKWWPYWLVFSDLHLTWRMLFAFSQTAWKLLNWPCISKNVRFFSSHTPFHLSDPAIRAIIGYICTERLSEVEWGYRTYLLCQDKETDVPMHGDFVFPYMIFFLLC